MRKDLLLNPFLLIKVAKVSEAAYWDAKHGSPSFLRQEYVVFFF